MTKTGRPPKAPEERRRVVGLSMDPQAIESLRKLAQIRGESQGTIVGRLVVAALTREQRKSVKN
ncbi:MAG: hypothetical protein NVSMB64_10690 [Candidatus Velthaea sp.]